MGSPIRHSVRRRSKYGNKPAMADGIRFDSKKERDYYQRLRVMQDSGAVVMFLRQVPLHLPGNIRYVLDFQVFWADGTVEWIDVKGMRTDTYKLKKAQVEDIYPITITEV